MLHESVKLKHRFSLAQEPFFVRSSCLRHSSITEKIDNIPSENFCRNQQKIIMWKTLARAEMIR